MVQEVIGTIYIQSNVSTSDFFALAVGIYVAEQLPNGVTWSVRDPLSTQDAGRDDYLFLYAIGFHACPNTGSVSPQVSQPLAINVRIPRPEVIGGGEALVMTISMTSNGGQSLGLCPFIRSRIKSVV
jgi:hypothetical protein